MSSDLYSTLLRWDGRRGLAKLHGREVPLSEAPDLGGGPVHRCEYIPEIRLQDVQPRPCDPRRDYMTRAELEAADRLLAELVASGK